MRRACRSRASRSAILFSKPCCLRLEKGRLSGSAQTRYPRICPRSGTEVQSTIAIARSLRQREDIKHSSLPRVLWQILHGVAEAESDRWISCVQSSGDDRSGPSTDAREDRNVLL